MNYNEWRSGDLPEPLLESTGFLLAWVAAHSGEQYDRVLASCGLKAHHVGVLTLLQDGPMPQSRLSERLGIFKPAMVAILRDLEEMALVRRQPHPTDGRALEVHLLPAGRQRLKVVEEISRRAADEFFAPFTPQERQTFHQLLAKLAGDTRTKE
ncbi:MarR family winged helix-turn-helix transcriptional regulator [Nonomuraea fuscirosea]|uniref:MarR family winged helix-turn-helix transcriptional regulator n=1 Tax=Nonomuraea fuscirosea TaxID=1291556 RepID=UPI00341D6D39